MQRFHTSAVGTEPKYTGDWLRRPVASDEVGALVVLCVRASDMIADMFGPRQAPTPVSL